MKQQTHMECVRLNYCFFCGKTIVRRCIFSKRKNTLKSLKSKERIPISGLPAFVRSDFLSGTDSSIDPCSNPNLDSPKHR